MAPNLAESQKKLISGMIPSDSSFTNLEIAEATGCSSRSVQAIRSNLRYFGSTKAPQNGGGRKRSITPPMLNALCEHLLKKPESYRSEIVVFLWNESEVLVSTDSIGRVLASEIWTTKVIRRISQARDPDLRDWYLHTLKDFHSYHLIFADESGCDKRSGFRRTGWSPLGTTPLQITRFQRENRYQILPAYIHKTGSYMLAFFRDQQTLLFLRISLTNYSLYVADSQNRSQFLL